MKHIIDDSDKNKYEAYTKEEVLSLLQEVAESGELPDEINGLILTFKNPVDNQAYKIAFCTQAKYNELEAGGLLEANCVYYITDDTTYDDLIDAFGDLEDIVETYDSRITTNTTNIASNTTEINKIKNGTTIVDSSINAYRLNVVDMEITDGTGDQTSYVNNITKTGLYAFVIELSNGGSSWDRLTTLMSIYDLSVQMKQKVNTIYGDGSYNLQYISSTNKIMLVKNYSETNIYKIVDCKLITPYDQVTIVNNPTYITEFDYEDGGWDYNKVIITNPNNQAATLYYKLSTASDYTSVSINANGTYNIGTYRSDITGTMYLKIGSDTSQVVNWSAS